MRVRVGAGILALMLVLGKGASGVPQETKAEPGKDAKAVSKPPFTASLDSTVRGTFKNPSAPLADDGEFLRRVMLDLVGYPPNLTEVKAFIADADPSKRVRKIDELVESDAWADMWSRQFAETYFGNWHDIEFMTQPALSKQSSQRVVQEFMKWIKGKLKKDKPYTEIVFEILDARGKDEGDPALAYKLNSYNGEGHAIEFARNVAKDFLGIQLHCARCHDHPFDQWTTDHYYGLAAFNARQRARGYGGSGEKDRVDHIEIKEAEDGEFMIPNLGLKRKESKVNLADGGGAAKPVFLFGGEAGKYDMRSTMLAKFMTMKGNTQLPRALVNRVWGWLFGRGIVDPVDDFNDVNRRKATATAALESLTREFNGNMKGSIKLLVKTICNTMTYQATCAHDKALSRDVDDFSRGSIKQLTGEQLMNAIEVAISGRASKNIFADRDAFATLFPPGAQFTETTKLPGNARQALLMRNGIASRISGPMLSQALQAGSNEEKLDNMFLAALSRKPSENESKRFLGYVTAHSGSGWEDAYWALLNTAEFVTRH